MAPNKLSSPASFKFTGSRDLTSAASIFENSKKDSCEFASYRVLLELNFFAGS